MPFPLPRRIAWVRASIASPRVLPSPNGRRVGIRIVTFEACSGFTRYGLPDRSTAQGGLCHEASTRPVTRPSRSLASRLIDNYLGEILPHRCFAPSGRTAKLDEARRQHDGAKELDERLFGQDFETA